CRTCCLLTRPLRNSFVLEKGTPQSHSRDDEQYPLTQTSIYDYSYAEQLLSQRQSREPSRRHWPQSPQTTHQVLHPRPHCPRTSISKPPAVIPHPTSQRHLLIDSSRVPYCGLSNTRSSAVRLQPFFESVLFQ
ncbi:hypothetical protein N431DRAFT_527835, partial [Stipitochalara longipes BDJ]